IGNGFDISARRFAASGTPLDAQEFTVNTTLTGNQIDPSVAVEPNGAFTIGWVNIANFFNAQPVLTARRFNANGTPAGGEFLLDNGGAASGYAGGPSLAVGSDGELAAVWAKPAGTNGVYFRLFSTTNTPLEAQPVTVTTQSTLGAVVGMGPDEHFVVAW